MIASVRLAGCAEGDERENPLVLCAMRAGARKGGDENVSAELLNGLAWKKDFYKHVPSLVGANGMSLNPNCWTCVDYLMGGCAAAKGKNVRLQMRTDFLACDGLDRVYLSVSKLAEAGIETVLRNHDPHLLVNTKEVIAFYGEAIKVPIFKQRGLWKLVVEPSKKPSKEPEAIIAGQHEREDDTGAQSSGAAASGSAE
eukprot:2927640-Amphidinium_carterae.1